MSSDSVCVAAEVTDLGSASSLHEPAAGQQVFETRCSLVRNDGQRFGTVEFETFSQRERLSSERQSEFIRDFCREIAQLEQWGAENDWLVSPPALRVFVSDRYRISKSLVPAWSGAAGYMEFPSWRVIARKAAIAHELVHVFYPNGNRLLAEGLAVYLQAENGGNPAFPNFGRPLHMLAHERLCDMVAPFSATGGADFEPVRLADLDAIPTPSPLTLKVESDSYGEEPRGQAFIYPLAGSFVQHLIESRGLKSFRTLYEFTPLVPSHQEAGSPGRWNEVYGYPLSRLEREWKLMVAGKQTDERKLQSF